MAAPIAILHDDEHLLVVDKPAGVLAVAAPGRREPTLIDLLTRQLGTRVHAVHRLDEGTTGAMVVARTEGARDAMDPLFRQHLVRREYLALVVGRPAPSAGRIESQLRDDGDLVRVVERGGQLAITDYESLDRRGRLTLVCCRLQTGRRNQIRVHLAFAGLPVVGDSVYGKPGSDPVRADRQLLHASKLGFNLPDGKRVVFAAALPQDFEAALRELRERERGNG